MKESVKAPCKREIRNSDKTFVGKHEGQTTWNTYTINSTETRCADVDWTGAGYGQMTEATEHGHGPLVSIKAEFLLTD